MQAAAPETFDVGVLVGRFQVHELHAGHKELIEYVCGSHDKVVIFLGLSPLMVTLNNPLDFEARKQMILDAFPDVIVLYIKDMPGDDVWSRRLDEQIADVVSPSQSVMLYGGRDSFIDRYSGKYPTQELLQESFYSGRVQRRAIIGSRTKRSADFRAGVVWAAGSRYPTAYQTVDVAILDGRKLLLGRKPNQAQFRFIGGFSDPRSPSLEADVRREVSEETGVSVDGIQYVGSVVVDDWRYRDEADCIKTALFTAQYTFGRPTPGDDIEEVRWFDLQGIRIEHDIVPEHRPLMGMLRDHLRNGGS